MLPWAGIQIVRETESALREGQQRWLAGAAQAIADALAQFPREFLVDGEAATYADGQLYAHALPSAPLIDGYFSDWILSGESLVALGEGGFARFALGTYRQYVFLYLEVHDEKTVYALPGAGETLYADKVDVVSVADDRTTTYAFAPEAPGPLIAVRNEIGRAHV